MHDYFKLFDLPPVYILDPEILRNRYLALQHQHHPDRVSEEFKEQSLQYSIFINQAFNVLKDELKRAEHLGNLLDNNFQGISIPTDPEFLEYIWQALQEVDASNNFDELQNLLKQYMDKRAQLIEEIARAFAIPQLSLVKQRVISLKYFTTLLENIRTKIGQCL